MSLSEFAHEVALLYSNCVSYRDTGTVKSVDQTSGVFETGKFVTEFKRHEYFKLEWQAIELEKTLVLHSDVNGTRLTSSSGFSDQSNSLELGICSLFGVTKGVAYLVPTLLLPTLVSANPRITALKNMKISPVADGSRIEVCGQMTGDDYQLLFDVSSKTLAHCLITSKISKEALNAAIVEMSSILASQNIAIPEAAAFSSVVEISYTDVNLIPNTISASA